MNELMRLDELHRQYDGPIPREAWLAARRRPEPGTREASDEAWQCVRYWANESRAATNEAERAMSRDWLRLAIERWMAARREEHAYRAKSAQGESNA